LKKKKNKENTVVRMRPHTCGLGILGVLQFVKVLLLICQVSNSTLMISNFQDVHYALNYDIIKGSKHMIDVQCNRKGPF
jgi:hypothetical protein